jgi:hypothetical protein
MEIGCRFAKGDIKVGVRIDSRDAPPLYKVGHSYIEYKRLDAHQCWSGLGHPPVVPLLIPTLTLTLTLTLTVTLTVSYIEYE